MIADLCAVRKGQVGIASICDPKTGRSCVVMLDGDTGRSMEFWFDSSTAADSFMDDAANAAGLSRVA